MQSSKWLTRTFLLFALAVTAWAGFISWDQLERHKRITNEVAALEAEARRMKIENQTLEERISYFSTKEFREQEARQKLGLKKADELVVAIKEEGREESLRQESESTETPSTEIQKPNYYKWWELFAK